MPDTDFSDQERAKLLTRIAELEADIEQHRRRHARSVDDQIVAQQNEWTMQSIREMCRS